MKSCEPTMYSVFISSLYHITTNSGNTNGFGFLKIYSSTQIFVSIEIVQKLVSSTHTTMTRLFARLITHEIKLISLSLNIQIPDKSYFWCPQKSGSARGKNGTSLKSQKSDENVGTSEKPRKPLTTEIIVLPHIFIGVRARPRSTCAPAPSEGSFGFWVWMCTMTGLTAGRD